MTSRPEPREAVVEEKPTPNPATDERLTKLSAMLAKTKATDVDRSQALLKRYLAKATDTQLERVVNDACKSSKGEAFGVAYLDPIVERIVSEDARARRAAQRRVAGTQRQIAEQRAVQASPKPDNFPAVRTNGHWWHERSEIVSRGTQEGVRIVAGEPFDEYTARVFAAMGPGPWEDEALPPIREKIDHYRAVGVNPITHVSERLARASEIKP